MNQGQLIDAVAAQAGVSRAEAEKVLTTAFDVVTAEVTAGHTVAITNFCSWTPVQRPSRRARNPQTGEKVIVPARRAVRVRALPRLVEIVAAGDPAASRRKRSSRRRTEPPQK